MCTNWEKTPLQDFRRSSLFELTMNTPMPTPTATNSKTRVGMMQAVACNLCFAVYAKRRAAPDTSVANFVCKRCADEQPG